MTKARGFLLAVLAVSSAYGCEERAGDLPILEQAPIAALRAPTHSTASSEAQSVDVLSALNRGEIDLARYALGRARTRPARDLAQTMVDGHTQAQAHVEAWAQTAGVGAAPNDIAPTVQHAITTVRASLEATPDAQFDEAYVRSQVEMHQDALRILDEHVLPGGRDASFVALVTTIRAEVAAHLERARAVAEELRG